MHDDDEFAFNVEFSDKHFRIKINTIQLKETKEENDKTNEKIFEDRLYQVDAAIVRIMKARKSLQHSALMAQLFEQLRFHVNPSDIKKRIESLIDRQYLRRDDSDSRLFHYVA